MSSWIGRLLLDRPVSIHWNVLFLAGFLEGAMAGNVLAHPPSSCANTISIELVTERSKCNGRGTRANAGQACKCKAVLHHYRIMRHSIGSSKLVCPRRDQGHAQADQAEPMEERTPRAMENRWRNRMEDRRQMDDQWRSAPVRWRPVMGIAVTDWELPKRGPDNHGKIAETWIQYNTRLDMELGPPATVPSDIVQADLENPYVSHQCATPAIDYEQRPWRTTTGNDHQLRIIGNWLITFIRMVAQGDNNCTQWFNANGFLADGPGGHQCVQLPNRAVIPQFVEYYMTVPVLHDGSTTLHTVPRPVFYKRQVSFQWRQYWRAIKHMVPTCRSTMGGSADIHFPPQYFHPTTPTDSTTVRYPDACFITHNGEPDSSVVGADEYMFVFAWLDDDGKAFLIGARNDASGHNLRFEVDFGGDNHPTSSMSWAFAGGIKGTLELWYWNKLAEWYDIPGRPHRSQVRSWMVMQFDSPESVFDTQRYIARPTVYDTHPACSTTRRFMRFATGRQTPRDTDNAQSTITETLESAIDNLHNGIRICRNAQAGSALVENAQWDPYL
jgi:hypothetical protein